MLSHGIQGKLKDYKKVADKEKSRAKDGFKFLKEYECFYLYGKLDKDNNVLYRETFSKFDIDGVPKREKSGRTYCGKTHRGEF